MQLQINAIDQEYADTSSNDYRDPILNQESQNTIVNETDGSEADEDNGKAPQTFFPVSSDEKSNDKSPSENDSPSIDDEEIVDEDDEVTRDDKFGIEEEAVDEESPEITDEEDKAKVF